MLSFVMEQEAYLAALCSHSRVLLDDVIWRCRKGG